MKYDPSDIRDGEHLSDSYFRQCPEEEAKLLAAVNRAAQKERPMNAGNELDLLVDKAIGIKSEESWRKCRGCGQCGYTKTSLGYVCNVSTCRRVDDFEIEFRASRKWSTDSTAVGEMLEWLDRQPNAIFSALIPTHKRNDDGSIDPIPVWLACGEFAEPKVAWRVGGLAPAEAVARAVVLVGGEWALIHVPQGTSNLEFVDLDPRIV